MVGSQSNLRVLRVQYIVARPSAYIQVSSIVLLRFRNTYNTFRPQGHFLVAQPLVIVPSTCTINVAVAFVGLTPDCSLQELVGSILILHFTICRWMVIIGMHPFLFCILWFGSWLCLLDMSQSLVSTYDSHKVSYLYANCISACQWDLAVNASKCGLPVCIVLQVRHLTNVS